MRILRIINTITFFFLFTCSAIGQMPIPFYKNGKWGLLSHNKQVIHEAIYENIILNRGTQYITVQQKHFRGLMNWQGEWVLKPRFGAIRVYSPTVIEAFEKEHWKIYMFKNDTFIDKPHSIERKLRFGPDITAYFLSNTRVLLVNKRKHTTAVLSVDAIDRVISFEDCDLLVTSTKTSSVLNPKRYGLFDLDGNTVISPRYSIIKPISPEGHVLKIYPLDTINHFFPAKDFLVRSNTGMGVINNNDSLIIPAIYLDITPTPFFFIAKAANATLIFRRDGQQINLPFSATYQPIGEKFITYSLPNTRVWGVIDTLGSIILPNRFTEIELHASEHFFLAKRDTMWGVYNLKGQELLPCEFSKKNIQILHKKKKIKALRSSDSIMMNVVLDNQNSIIDRLEFANYTFIKQKDDPADNYWERDLNQGSSTCGLWGVFSASHKRLVPYTFRHKFPLRSSSRYYITQRGSGKWTKGYRSIFGLIDIFTTQMLLLNEQRWIYFHDLEQADIFRSISTSRRFSLLSRELKPLHTNCSFVDPPSSQYIRVARGGGLVLRKSPLHSIEVPNAIIPKIFKEKKSQDPSKLLSILGAKWILIDQSGNRVLSKSFSFMELPFRNRIIVKSTNRWGIINFAGDTLVPFQYNDIKHFYNHAKPNAWLDMDYYKVQIDGLYGAIDHSGKTIIPAKYEDIKMLPNNNGIFFAVKQQNLWSLIDIHQEVIIPLQYQSISYLSPHQKEIFKTQRAHFEHGYVNAQFRMIPLPHGYRHMEYNNGYFLSRGTSFNNLLLDTLGNKAWPEQRNLKIPSDGLIWTSQDYKTWALLNLQRDSIAKGWSDARRFSHKLAPVREAEARQWLGFHLRKKWGFINEKGKLVLDYTWIRAESFNKFGLAKVRRGKNWGLIDTTGKTILPTQYRQIKEFSSSGTVLVRTNSRRWGLLDKNGQWILKPKYKEISTPSDGLIRFRKSNRKYGYADTLGNIVIPAKFKRAEDFQEGYAVVRYKRNGSKRSQAYGFINKLGEFKVNPCFNYVSNVKDSLFYTANSPSFRSVRRWSNINAWKAKVKEPIPGTTLRISELPHNLGFQKIRHRLYKCVNKSGDRIIPYYFRSVQQINEFTFQIEKYSSGKKGILHIDGTYKNLVMFDKLTPLGDSFYYFILNKKYELYNSSGKLISNSPYYEIRNYGNYSQLRGLRTIDYILNNGDFFSYMH